jgi:predicted PurR-regulated permease PerM
MQTPQSDLTRTFLVILIIAMLIVGSLWTLLPFLGGLIWAGTIVVATWPLLLKVQRLAGGRRAVATATMTIVMLLIFIVPFALAVGVLLEAAVEGVDLVKAAVTVGLKAPPAWLTDIPWVGPRLTERWHELAAGGPDAIAGALRPFVRSTASWALSLTGGFGLVIVHFLLTVILAAVLYANGEATARGVLMFAHRIGGERGENTMRLAGQAVRGVALGVIVTALVQSIIAGIGLWLAGVPRPGLLLAIIFVLCVAQLGPIPVLLPAIIWMFWSGSVGWGSALIGFTVVVAVVDNVMKPLLIRRGVDLPLLLIIAGVIGGLIGFGVVGLFIGPVILAVTYTLLESWIREDPGTAQVAVGEQAKSQ